MDMDFKSNPFIWIWIGSRLDFEKFNTTPNINLVYANSS